MSYDYENSLDRVDPMKGSCQSSVSKAQLLSHYSFAQKIEMFIIVHREFKKLNFSTLNLNFMQTYINLSFHSIFFFMQTGFIQMKLLLLLL